MELLKIVSIISMNCYLENFVQITIINKFSMFLPGWPSVMLKWKRKSPCMPGNIRISFSKKTETWPLHYIYIILSFWQVFRIRADAHFWYTELFTFHYRRLLGWNLICLTGISESECLFKDVHVYPAQICWRPPAWLVCERHRTRPGSPIKLRSAGCLCLVAVTEYG